MYQHNKHKHDYNGMHKNLMVMILFILYIQLYCFSSIYVHCSQYFVRIDVNADVKYK